MVKLESYSNLSKKQEDLLGLGYVYHKLFSAKVTTKTNQGVEVVARAGQTATTRDLLFNGSCQLSYSKGDLKVTAKANSNGDLRGTAEIKPKDYVKDVKIKAEVKANQKSTSTSGTFTVDYTSDLANIKFALSDGPIVKLNGTFGKEGVGLGFSTGYNGITSKIIAYNTSLFWFQKNSRLVFRHSAAQLALENFNLSYFQKINQDIKVGVNVEYPWNQLPRIEFGGSFQWHKDTQLKAKVNSQGRVAVALKQNLTNNIKASIASELNATKLTSASIGDCKLGVHLDFE